MHRECRERFPRNRLQRKPLFSDSGMHRGTCGTHVPWYMSGSLTHGSGENVPCIPGECATRNFTYMTRGPWLPCCQISKVIISYHIVLYRIVSYRIISYHIIIISYHIISYHIISYHIILTPDLVVRDIARLYDKTSYLISKWILHICSSLIHNVYGKATVFIKELYYKHQMWLPHRDTKRRNINVLIKRRICDVLPRLLLCHIVIGIAIDQSISIILIVRRAGLLWSQQDFEWWWSVPLSSASLY